MALLKRILRALPLLAVSPLLVALAALALAATDLAWFLFGRRKACPQQARPVPTAASIVIPNWNGKDLLEKYLPSVVEALAANPAHEIVVVDNGSTDGSAAFVKSAFPQVRLLALPGNRGFGGGSNAGVRAARNDIVVLLNSDMRVAPDFLAPLLEGFADAAVFAVSCQIFFSDPRRPREESGLTQGWWQDGCLRVRHRRRILRLRPRQIPRAGRLRSPVRALLPGGHRPRIPGLEARMEDALPTAQRGLSRTPRHYRQALHRGAHRSRSAEELPAVRLEEHS
jgi:hypothetical protein